MEVPLDDVDVSSPVCVLGLVLVLAIAVPGGGWAAEPATGEPPAEPWTYRWLDVDGAPLPFESTDEVLDFLGTARVISSRDAGRGITRPRKVLLEKDGVRAHAIFRHVDRLTHVERSDIVPFSYFRDRHSYEVAAFELSRMLGIGRVPPVVLREIDGVDGSLQIWLEEVIMDVDRRDRALEPPDRERWNQQRQTLRLFDNVIGNHDRNLGNLLVDRGWSLWFIDHSRSFVPSNRPLHPEAVFRCDREVWRTMQGLETKDLRERLKPYLDRAERNALAGRFTAMVRHIRERIEEHGEEAVLFDPAGVGAVVEDWAEAGGSLSSVEEFEAGVERSRSQVMVHDGFPVP